MTPLCNLMIKSNSNKFIYKLESGNVCKSQIKSGKAVYYMYLNTDFLSTLFDISLKVIHLFVYMKSLPFQCEHCWHRGQTLGGGEGQRRWGGVGGRARKVHISALLSTSQSHPRPFPCWPPNETASWKHNKETHI